MAKSQEIIPLNNTVGIYYERGNDVRISNNHWNLIVYKDLKLIKTAFENAERSLRMLEKHVFKPDLKFHDNLQHFIIPLKPHYTMLKSISNKINEKINNIGITTMRRKRYLLNAAGSLIKWITGNLDENDGKYFNEAIDRLEKDDTQTQSLMRSQISITTKIIKSFNHTIRKLMIDDQYLENNLKSIQTFLNKNEEKTYYLARQVEILNNCESLLEVYMLLSNEINDIENSLTFAKLKVLHPSIISSMQLLEQLTNISNTLAPNEILPASPNVRTIGQIANLITLKGFTTANRVVFILNIPLTSNEVYTSYHLFSIPTRHPSSNLFHTIVPESKYIGISQDNREYIRTNEIESCKKIDDTLLCFNILPYPGEKAPCEINIISKLHSENCKSTIMALDDFNVQELKKNKWLIILSKPLPIKITCGQHFKTQMIYENSLLKLTQGCRAFVGSIQISAAEHNTTKQQSDDIIPVIPFNCCDDIPDKIEELKLQPVPLRNIRLDEFNEAQSSINDFEEQLNKLNHESFPYRRFAFSTITTIATIILILLCYCCRCHKRAWRMFKGKPYEDHNSYCPQIFNQCSFAKGPQRRTNYRVTEYHTGEDNLSIASIPEVSTNINNETQLNKPLRRVIM